MLTAAYVFNYAAVWLAQYLIYRRQIRALDAKIKAANRKEEV